MGNMVYVMLTLLMNIRLAFGETAFDCAAPGIKVATYDLLNTAPCPEYQSIYRTKVMRRAQLLQLGPRLRREVHPVLPTDRWILRL